MVTVSCPDDFQVYQPSIPDTPRKEANAMPNHKVGTREEWSTARKALLEREQELGKVDEELEKLEAYKQRMGWKFPYVSSFGSDFNFDFDFAFTPEQMATGELAKMVSEPDDWLKDWAENVGTDLASGMAESPGWNVFALKDGGVYHTYSRTAPDRFLLAPYYSQLLDQVPSGRDADFPLRRHDEY